MPSTKSGLSPRVLQIENNTHMVSDMSKGLLAEIGGVEKLVEMCTRFYNRALRNPHLEPFFLYTDVNIHAPRLAYWIAEKMGDSNKPWSRERATRSDEAQEVAVPVREKSSGRPTGEVKRSMCPVHDRSSAHMAAWHCVKRQAAPTHTLGEHFKLDDARAWMRLHFWACRETGLFDNSRFKNWYERFIGHFVRIYDHEAPAFARLESKWSDKSTKKGRDNIAKYLKVQEDPAYFSEHKHGMDDIIGERNARRARRQAGLSDKEDGWPYFDNNQHQHWD